MKKYFYRSQELWAAAIQACGPDWGWCGESFDGKKEGHVKELQDGSNTMYIFHREGNPDVFWDVFMWADNPIYQPTDDDYIKATEKRAAVQQGGKLPITWARLKKH